jgi:hypothetical protein
MNTIYTSKESSKSAAVIRQMATNLLAIATELDAGTLKVSADSAGCIGETTDNGGGWRVDLEMRFLPADGGGIDKAKSPVRRARKGAAR